MSMRLSVLTGGKAGSLVRFRTGPVVIGRAAESDLRLDAELDLAVSARHAILELDGEDWYVRDAGSTNGTILNGTWVRGRVRLEEGDRIFLGASGPTLRFHRESPGRIHSLPPTEDLGPTGPLDPVDPGLEPSPMDSQEPVPVQPSTGAPTRSGIGSPVLWTLAGLVAAAALVAVIMLPLQRERAEVRELTQRLDSLQETSRRLISGLRDQVSGLESALEASRSELEELGEDLQRARTAGDRGQTAVLEQRLREATEELGRKERAAGIDFGTVAGLNRPALAEIYLEFEDGEVRTATAFSVQPDGLLLTNRHVVEGPGGVPSRIAVQFSGSDRVWPADLVTRSDEADLAALQLLGAAEIPVIAGFHRRPDTLEAGMPVAILGFPLGGVGTDGARPEAAVGAGTVRALVPTQLQVDGYGAPGSSGSPVLDPEGQLVGVVRGGQERADGTTLVAVPSSVVLRFMEDVLARKRAAAPG